MKKRVLFVCLGNICRSPAAEAVFQKFVEDDNLVDRVTVDSAGISDWHKGEPAHKTMRKLASLRGYDVSSISRPFNPNTDYGRFDYIIGMDRENIYDLKSRARTPENLSKISAMAKYATRFSIEQVPDPYSGSDDVYEHVLDILEDACRGLLNVIKEESGWH
ncbi:MAG: low molecular weight phosphotyrosine protein phosphatase [Prolixibacteraceae bacterium]|nr:low molecular weight phosphotyrosine protein phosphatase [Prolixibacteraceae bacterium]